MSYYDKKTARIISSVLVLVLGLFLLYLLKPYLEAFVGAVLFSVVFYPLYEILRNKTKLPKISAAIMVFLAILLIVIPLVITIPLIIKEINDLFLTDEITISLTSILDEKIQSLDLNSYVSDFNQKIVSFSQKALTSIVGSLANLVINIAIGSFTIFYILINKDKLKESLINIIPFSEKSSKELINRFGDLTKSILVSLILIALFQGFFLGLTFYILGIEGAFLWGFISFILALLPLVGIPVVWIPASIILFIQGLLFESVVIFAAGFILSNVDIFIRAWLHDKFGKIHPLITLVGVILGISTFGMLGVFIGPLLLIYSIAILKIYRKEYLSS